MKKVYFVVDDKIIQLQNEKLKKIKRKSGSSVAVAFCIDTKYLCLFVTLVK